MVGVVVMIVFMAPLFLFLALAVKLTGRGPLLVREQRIGRAGRPFYMITFRTTAARSLDGACKPTLTGRVLRRFDLIGSLYFGTYSEAIWPLLGRRRFLLKRTTQS